MLGWSSAESPRRRSQASCPLKDGQVGRKDLHSTQVTGGCLLSPSFHLSSPGKGPPKSTKDMGSVSLTACLAGEARLALRDTPVTSAQEGGNSWAPSCVVVLKSCLQEGSSDQPLERT